MQKEIEKIFVDLIQTYLDLPDNYGEDSNGNIIPCVVIRSQNIKLFNTPNVQITVGTLQNRIFSNRQEFREELINDEIQYFEDIYINEQRSMQIDIYSKNNDARILYPKVQACLNSVYAQQLQEKYQFRISKISDANNISGVDGGSEINRFSIRFQCLSWNKYTKQIDYYDTFRVQARNKNNNVFADFTIKDNQIITN